MTAEERAVCFHFQTCCGCAPLSLLPDPSLTFMLADRDLSLFYLWRIGVNSARANNWRQVTPEESAAARGWLLSQAIEIVSVDNGRSISSYLMSFP